LQRFIDNNKLYSYWATFLFLIKLDAYKTKKILNHLTGFYSKLILWVLDIKVILNQSIKTKPYFIVSNHLSYLDILIISSIKPTSYVTSLDIKNTLGLGQITEIAGCLYVNRKSRNNITRELEDIINALKNGLSVTVFPEATSTNGERVIRFKRSLYEAALESKTEVLPVCINYLRINDQNISKDNRDSLCWYGEMDFLSHLWKLCRQRKVEVELKVLDEIQDFNQDSKTLRDYTYELIASSFIAFT
jgi:1-acyl-sn-glycerol-3-phosphate acyltransferase